MRKNGRHAITKPTLLSKLRTAVSFGMINVSAVAIGCAATVLGHFDGKDSSTSRYIDAVS
jgi:hypothetical protein